MTSDGTQAKYGKIVDVMADDTLLTFARAHTLRALTHCGHSPIAGTHPLRATLSIPVLRFSRLHSYAALQLQFVVLLIPASHIFLLGIEMVVFDGL